MKKRKSLADLLFEEQVVMLNEEDDEGGDDIFGDDDSGDDSGDDDSGDDGGGDDAGDDSGEEEGGDEDSEEDSGDEDSDDSGDEEDDEEEKPSGPSDDTIDGEVNNLLSDFEAEAVASAEQAAALKGESYLRSIHKRSMSKVLFESDDASFDVAHFADNVARVINNYQTLLDVEKMIFDKAKAFLDAKYGEQVAKEFEDVLDSQHQISFITGAGADSSKVADDQVPIAAGAITPQ